jgi:hypothetical protein
VNFGQLGWPWQASVTLFCNSGVAIKASNFSLKKYLQQLALFAVNPFFPLPACHQN